MQSNHAVSARESGALTQSLPAPAAGRPRTWLRRIMGGGQTIESCPSWCTNDHLHAQGSALADLTHTSEPIAAEVEVFDMWADGEAVTLQASVLSAQIRQNPYSENAKRNLPFVAFEPTDGEIADELSPEEFAEVIDTLQAHVERLRLMHARLVQARAEHPGAPTAA